MPVRRPLAALIAVTTVAGCARAPAPGTASAPAGAQRPALVVMLVVDQLRPGLLDRYDDLYTGGFRRLLDRGRLYTRATHDHAQTWTAAGHATLATGVYPSRHGIVANEWYERVGPGADGGGGRWLQVSNVGDSTVRIVGHPGLRGVSPHYVARPGLADWLAAASPRSLIASVSPKDRGAVQPVSRARGHVYWFDTAAAGFVTSTYYRDADPEWVARFNRDVAPRYAADTVWESTVPAAARGRSRPDTLPSEGNGRDTYFPHRFAAEGRGSRFWAWFERTPMLDALALDFAREAVTSLGLGRDEVPDFLNVSLSQTDRVGHDYGPLSREQLDNLLRLDRGLGEFFAFLDATVGAGRWALGLSADHGAPVSPEDLPQPGEDYAGRRRTPAERAAIDSIRVAANRRAADPTTPAWVAEQARRLPVVADAWTHDELARGQGRVATDSFAVLARRSYYPGRVSGAFGRQGVDVRFVPGFIERARGVDHGSPYWYDRHVPMLFVGPGIAPGRDATRASTTDFAPTLARLLGVPVPGDLDGRALAGVVGGR
jgi:hypothetical protein